jgi:hypothetical protein
MQGYTIELLFTVMEEVHDENKGKHKSPQYTLWKG